LKSIGNADDLDVHTKRELYRAGVCLSQRRDRAHGHWKSPRAWHYTEMGRLVADAGKRDWDELKAEYGVMLVEGHAVMGCKRSGRGQACECPSAPGGVPEGSPVERGQRLPVVGWSFWASSRTTGRGLCR